MNKNILSALIGLCGAINNNGKTDQTDTIVRNALISDEQSDWVEKIHREKFTISPTCEFCQTPCGNTSDYPMEKYDLWTLEEKALKNEVYEELKRIASKLNQEELPLIVYKAISYIGYDLKEESYVKLLEEMKTW